MIRSLFIFALLAPAAAQEAAAPAVPAAQKFDFQDLNAGAVPDGYTSTDQDANFHIVAEGDNKCLELQPQPIVDGGMLVGKAVKGPCVVAARIKAAGKRRTQPRFGVGLYGVSGPRLRVVPAAKHIEIVSNTDKEEAVATAPYAWTSGTWTRLEMIIKAGTGGQGSVIEARVWEDGKPRPGEPSLTWNSPAAPAQGKASVWGTPYAGLPLQFDDIEVSVP